MISQIMNIPMIARVSRVTIIACIGKNHDTEGATHERRDKDQ
jgi:hypothetical protein